jgi:epoxyqueuosine reductase
MLSLSQQIKAEAQRLGFADCGITAAGPSRTHAHFQDWIARGLHADMQWMARPEAQSKRADLNAVLPGVQSMVCVAMHYRTREAWPQSTLGSVARYARGVDYHEVMTKRLRELLAWIQIQTPCQGRVYVDTGPILEREWAQRAGIGWVGKNTLLMSRRLGSYFLLGEILLDCALEYDRPHVENFCGSCTRCLDACPTQAFEAPFVLNAGKCISYHTIENGGRAPVELKENFGDWIFGCDICQEVCPWNAKSTFESAEPELWRREEFPHASEWISLPQEEFSRRMSKSPLKRTKRRGMKRNALRALKNRRHAQVKAASH